MWNTLRPGANNLDPDIPGSLSDGLYSGDFAATNLGMAGGQVGADIVTSLRVAGGSDQTFCCEV